MTFTLGRCPAPKVFLLGDMAFPLSAPGGSSGCGLLPIAHAGSPSTQYIGRIHGLPSRELNPSGLHFSTRRLEGPHTRQIVSPMLHILRTMLTLNIKATCNVYAVIRGTITTRYNDIVPFLIFDYSRCDVFYQL